MSESFCDARPGVSLCYESFGDRSDPPALLVMGLGMQMIAWHDDWCEQLASRGFYVVRFDNRDAGRSTHFEGTPPTVRQLLLRRFRPGQYTLHDMAEDTVGLLRELELAPAHVIGVSMGGMIGQALAARHPDSVRSLTSIMSTTGNRFRGQPALAMYRLLLRRAPTDREGFVNHAAKVFAMIGSPGFPRDDAVVRDLAARSWDRDHDPYGTGRQLAGILAAGDRTQELRNITTPTLVIHGDSDRLIAPSGGRATARAIRRAKLLTIPGMGHDLPRDAWPRLLDSIQAHANAVDGVPQPA